MTEIVGKPPRSSRFGERLRIRFAFHAPLRETLSRTNPALKPDPGGKTRETQEKAEPE